MPDIHTLVLVEGDSDVAAVRALAGLFGRDLEAASIVIHSAGGVTNFSKALGEFVREQPRASVCGLYDIAEERHVQRALARAGISAAPGESPEPFGFFACVADLEDELIRALGAEAVEDALEAQDELDSFRRFQAMPHHRDTPVDQQLRRFLGTRATRKIRSAQALVERLDVDRLPRPLRLLAGRLFDIV